MKLLTTILAALHVSSYIVAAHPFVIISTAVQNAVPPNLHHPRQNFLDDLESAVNSVLGVNDGTTTVAAATTRASAVTLAAPVTATITTSSKQPKSTRSSSTDQETSDDSEGSAPTSSDGDSTTADSSSTTTPLPSTSDVTLSTPNSISAPTTSVPVPTAAQSSSSAAAATSSTGSSDDDAESSSVPAGGIAIAVIMILLILSTSAFLVFRYHPRCQAWWAFRQEKARQERCYREAIDGPNLSSSPSLRQQALAGGSSKRRTMLQSFFAPATARLSESSEIKRKPVNWGVPTSPPVPKIPVVSTPTSEPVPEPEPEPESEKLSMSASAAPLGQIERYSMVPAPISLPPPPPPPKSSPKSATTLAPPSASKIFLAELPACMPAAPSNQSQASTSISELPTRSLSVHNTPKTPTPTPTPSQTCPVSPMSLRAQPTSPMLTTVDQLTPISPMSTYTKRQPQGLDHMRSISSLTTSTVGANTGRNDLQDVPVLPPLPTLPALVHAKRGSDGVFRLA